MKKNITDIISKLILSDHTIRIKLLGDSITHGVGGSGFEQDGHPITAGFARNPNGYCWANIFRDYMETQYNCKVINNACTGTNIEFILKNFNELVSDDDEIVICNIGTNNRYQHFNTGDKHTKREYMEQFYKNILALYAKFQEIGKDVIFIANIPASASNEQDSPDYWRIFHMNDVHDLYLKASVECDFPLISFYRTFMDYCEEHKISVDSLLADGLHPNDEGHRVMFRLLMQELGLAMKVE